MELDIGVYEAEALREALLDYRRFILGQMEALDKYGSNVPRKLQKHLDSTEKLLEQLPEPKRRRYR